MKIILNLWITILVFIVASCQQEELTTTFRVDGHWYMPPAFHGNPYAPGGDGTHMHFLWNRLFLVIPQNGKIIPRLGSSYKVSKDRKKLSIKITKNIFWHDQTPFTSKDVKTTLLIRCVMNRNFKDIKKISTPNDETVIISMSTPMGLLDEKIIFLERIMIPYHLYGKFSKRAEEFLNRRIILNDKFEIDSVKWKAENAKLDLLKAGIIQGIFSFRPQTPIGTGPFKFSFVTASELFLTRFDKGIGGNKNNIDGVKILRSPSNDITWAYLIAGELDAGHPFTPQDVTEEILKLNPKMKLILPSDYEEFGFIFNMSRSPMSDIHFRKAVAYAVNKDIMRMVSYYYSSTIGPYNTAVLKSLEHIWLDSEIKNHMTQYNFDLSKAKSILNEAGYKKDDQGFFITPQGKKIELQISTMAGRSDWILGAESLTNQLLKLGIKAQIKSYEPSLFHQVLAFKQFDIATNFGTDYKGYAHPYPSYQRYFGRGGYIKKASGMPEKVKSFDGTMFDFNKHLAIHRKSQDENELKQLGKHFSWIANEYLPFLAIHEKNLMVFILDGKRVTGWPNSQDPIWSASSIGFESILSYLMSIGMVQKVSKNED